MPLTFSNILPPTQVPGLKPLNNTPSAQGTAASNALGTALSNAASGALKSTGNFLTSLFQKPTTDITGKPLNGAVPGLPDNTQKAGTYSAPVPGLGSSGGLINPKTLAPTAPSTSGNSGGTAQPVAGDPYSFMVNGVKYTNAPGGQSQTNSALQAPQSALPQPQQQNYTPQQPVQTPPPVPTNQGGQVTYPGTVNDLNQVAQGNLAIGQNAANIASQYGQQIADVGQQGANAQSGFKSTGTTPVALGNAAIIAQNTAAQQQALASGESAALQGTGQQLTAQGQAQSGLNSVAGLAAPVPGQAYGYNPLTGGLYGNSQGGGSGPSQTGNSLVDSSINQAVQLVKNGASVNDPQVQGLISPFGVLGTNAFTRAMQQSTGGTYNPTLQAASVGQNASEATSAQGQAFNLDTGLKQLSTITPIVTGFLNTSGINPTDNKHINDAISSYINNIQNPGATLQYNAIMGDISKFTSQLLAANNGQIPTAVTNTLSTFDPRSLSVRQLVPYLQTLATLGGNQLSVLQGQTNAAGGTGYAGTPTGTQSSTPVSPNANYSTITSGQAGQAVAGTGLNFIGGIDDLIHKVAGTAMSILEAL